MEDSSRKEQVTQHDWICSASLSLPLSSATCVHCGSPSHRVPLAPCTSWSLWHLAAQVASPSPCTLFAPHLPPCLCAAQWLSPLVDVLQILLSYTPIYSRESELLLAARSGLPLPLVQSSGWWSVELWQTVLFTFLWPYPSLSPHCSPCPVWGATPMWDFLAGKLVFFKHRVPSMLLFGPVIETQPVVCNF